MTMKVIEGKARKPWPCDFNSCGRKVEKGQEYYLWHIAGGVAQRQHVSHGEPGAAKGAAGSEKLDKKTKAAATKPKATAKKKATKKGGKKGGKK